MILRKKCFAEIGTFDESLPCFQDYDLWVRIARKFQFDYVQEPLLKYYIHEHKIWTNLEAITKGLEILLTKYGPSKALKKRCSKQYLMLGHKFCLRGDLKKGRKAFVKAIALNPFGTTQYVNYVASLFGAKGFKKLKYSKQQALGLLS